MTEREYMTVSETAAKLGASRSTVFSAIKRGRLEAVRLGGEGRYYVPVDALSAWRRRKPMDRDRSGGNDDNETSP